MAPRSDDRDDFHPAVVLRRALDEALALSVNPSEVLARMIVLTAQQYGLPTEAMFRAVEPRVWRLVAARIEQGVEVP